VLYQLTLLEREFKKLSIPTLFVRAGWFIENHVHDVAGARTGVISSFVQKLDAKIPMVATADIGVAIAEGLAEDWTGSRVVELASTRATINDVAATFGKILGHPVRAEPIPRAALSGIFQSFGVKDPASRIQLFVDLDDGKVVFEGSDKTIKQGKSTLEDGLRKLIAASP